MINSSHKFLTVEYVTTGFMCDVSKKLLFYNMFNMIILQKV